MTEPTSNKNPVSDEIKQLGENLKSVLTAFWESEERKSAAHQIEHGATEISKAIEKFADDVTKSEASQRLKTEVDDLQRRIQSGELEGKVREDIYQTLRKVNQELNQFSQRWSGSTDAQAGSDAEPAPEADEGT